MKKLLLTACFSIFAVIMYAQAPIGYLEIVNNVSPCSFCFAVYTDPGGSCPGTYYNTYCGNATICAALFTNDPISQVQVSPDPGGCSGGSTTVDFCGTNTGFLTLSCTATPCQNATVKATLSTPGAGTTCGSPGSPVVAVLTLQ